MGVCTVKFSVLIAVPSGCKQIATDFILKFFTFLNIQGLQR